MCINKRFIPHPSQRSVSHGTYVSCGTCPACLAEKANKRASLIRFTAPVNHTCYFVTLTYSNQFLPFIDISELYDRFSEYQGLVKQGFDPEQEDCVPRLVVPIYRHSYFTYGRGNKVLHTSKKCIGAFVHEDFSFDAEDFSTEIGNLCHPLAGSSGIDMSNCVSVAFDDDKVHFINRVRKRVFEALGEYDRDLKYFYAPEYGPTTCRFHVHFVLWIDNRLDPSQVSDIVKNSWDFMDYDTDAAKDFCQVAVNPAQYVSQYVNCSSIVSPLLTAIAPLRSSHSVGMGFDSPFLTLDYVHPYKEKFNLYFFKQVTGSDGTVKSYFNFVPKRFSYRFFPRCKSFSLLSEDSLIDCYLHVIRCREPHHVAGKFRDTQPLYSLGAVTVFGNLVLVTLDEYLAFRRRLFRSFTLYRKHLPNTTLVEYFRAIYRYYKSYSLFQYKMQFDKFVGNDVLDFDNLDWPIHTVLPPQTVRYSCNNNPLNFVYTDKLTKQFNDNIKQRKLNYFPSNL